MASGSDSVTDFIRAFCAEQGGQEPIFFEDESEIHMRLAEYPELQTVGLALFRVPEIPGRRTRFICGRERLLRYTQSSREPKWDRMVPEWTSLMPRGLALREIDPNELKKSEAPLRHALHAGLQIPLTRTVKVPERRRIRPSHLRVRDSHYMR